MILVVDKCLCPDLGIDFVLCVQVVANVILLLADLVELLLPVDVHSGDGLPEVGAALVLFELGVPHLSNRYLFN